MIKTFRGLLADGGQDQIRLQTIKGKVGYRIIKLQGFSANPGASEASNVLKIYKTSQSSITGTVDFTDSDLLAAIDFRQHTNEGYGVTANITIFDREMVNQDIYITQKDNNTGIALNYYLELEVIPLDDAGAEYTTLKDMRQPG